MSVHEERSPLAGQTVPWGSRQLRVEDWWDRLYGSSWMDADGNPAAMVYAMRGAQDGLPIDDEVVYGKVGRMGHLVHVSELGAQ